MSALIRRDAVYRFINSPMIRTMRPRPRRSDSCGGHTGGSLCRRSGKPSERLLSDCRNWVPRRPIGPYVSTDAHGHAVARAAPSRPSNVSDRTEAHSVHDLRVGVLERPLRTLKGCGDCSLNAHAAASLTTLRARRVHLATGLLLADAAASSASTFPYYRVRCWSDASDDDLPAKHNNERGVPEGRSVDRPGRR
jgi:hypothetical protein